jgi:hypothetical protein
MTDEDLKSLRAAPPRMLAEWWALLNRWEWPAEGLGQPESRECAPEGRRGQIMRWIMDEIGHKACLREWNRDSMTDAEFDAWWGRNA